MLRTQASNASSRNTGARVRSSCEVDGAYKKSTCSTFSQRSCLPHDADLTHVYVLPLRPAWGLSVGKVDEMELALDIAAISQGEEVKKSLQSSIEKTNSRTASQ